MRIEFKLKDKQEVTILSVDEKGKRKEIGHIFTPAGSGRYVKNAIQVCGFEEAYDLWGCGIYGEEKTTSEEIEIKEKKAYWNKNNIVMKKDIQLMFSSYDMARSRWGYRNTTDECWACFNTPCTCERKTATKKSNPYKIKRASELELEIKKEEKK